MGEDDDQSAYPVMRARCSTQNPGGKVMINRVKTTCFLLKDPSLYLGKDKTKPALLAGFACQFNTARVNSEEGASAEEMPP